MMTAAFQQHRANFPAQITSTFYFLPTLIASQQKIKRACNPTHGFRAEKLHNFAVLLIRTEERASDNTGFALGGFLVQICKFAILL
jgi:hypothetical protein